MKNPKLRLTYLLCTIGLALWVMGAIYAFADGEGSKAATSPSKFAFLVAALFFLAALLNQASLRERELNLGLESDQADDQIDRTATITSPQEVRFDLDDLGGQFARHQAAARRAEARRDVAYKKRWRPGRWLVEDLGFSDPSSLIVADGEIKEYRAQAGSRRHLAVTRLTDAGPQVVS